MKQELLAEREESDEKLVKEAQAGGKDADI